MEKRGEIMSTLTKVFLIYYSAINIILFILMGVDKARAKNEGWRIPEANLFVVSLLGGAAGGFLGMYTFKHKTKKIQFYLIYGLSVLLHFALIFLIFFKK